MDGYGDGHRGAESRCHQKGTNRGWTGTQRGRDGGGHKGNKVAERERDGRMGRGSESEKGGLREAVRVTQRGTQRRGRGNKEGQSGGHRRPEYREEGSGKWRGER